MCADGTPEVCSVPIKLRVRSDLQLCDACFGAMLVADVQDGICVVDLHAKTDWRERVCRLWCGGELGSICELGFSVKVC